MTFASREVLRPVRDVQNVLRRSSWCVEVVRAPHRGLTPPSPES